jgi:predicted Fe-Mo cluster-binding NifX family protein
MKIAFATMDGKTISQHFGRSPYYVIYTIENNQVVAQELRRRGTGHFAPKAEQEQAHEHNHEHEHDHSQGHGFGSEADQKHASMAQEIADCKTLVAGMMGQGAYNSFVSAGLEVIMSDYTSIEEATEAFINGTLKNLKDERTH